MKSYKLVRVEWYDASSHDDWQSVSDLGDESSECVTVGFLCKETDNDIYVAGTLCKDGEVCCVMQIPKRSIVKTTTLDTVYGLEVKE